MLNLLKNVKYKLISATMGIGLLASTGLASVVHASPINTNPANTNSAVTYNQNNESFKAELDRMLSAGEINTDQHTKMMELYNAGGDFKTGLDDLLRKGVINSNHHTKILDSFKKYPKRNNAPGPNTQNLALTQPIPQYHK